MELQRLYSYTRQAVDKFNMIDEGDNILIGISGGKDSLTLLYALAGLRRFYPKRFNLGAVSVNLGFELYNMSEISVLCDRLDVPLEIIDTHIADIVFKEKSENNPCSLCSKLRKGALNEYAVAEGYNKVAYAHHKDDVIETLMLSLIYEGRFNTFCPCTYLDKSHITVIRPLIFVNEVDIIGFKNKMNLPVLTKICPNDGYSKREYIKEKIAILNKENPGVKDRMFTAILNSNLDGWNE